MKLYIIVDKQNGLPIFEDPMLSEVLAETKPDGLKELIVDEGMQNEWAVREIDIQPY